MPDIQNPTVTPSPHDLPQKQPRNSNAGKLFTVFLLVLVIGGLNGLGFFY